MVDQDKRDTLRKVSHSSMIAAAMSLPMSAHALEGLWQAPANEAENISENTDLVLTFYRSTISKEGTPLCRVFLANMSSESVVLKKLNPGIIRTSQGAYDINQRLAKGDISVGPGGQYYFWIQGASETSIINGTGDGGTGSGRGGASDPANVGSDKRVKIKMITAMSDDRSESVSTTAVVELA